MKCVQMLSISANARIRCRSSRQLHAAEDALGDRLAAIGELSADDLSSLLNVVDGLVAKSRLRAMAGDLG